MDAASGFVTVEYSIVILIRVEIIRIGSIAEAIVIAVGVLDAASGFVTVEYSIVIAVSVVLTAGFLVEIVNTIKVRVCAGAGHSGHRRDGRAIILAVVNKC